VITSEAQVLHESLSLSLHLHRSIVDQSAGGHASSILLSLSDSEDDLRQEFARVDRRADSSLHIVYHNNNYLFTVTLVKRQQSTMAESNVEEPIVSNPETQLNGSDNNDINMINNETLPATTLEVRPQKPSSPHLLCSELSQLRTELKD